MKLAVKTKKSSTLGAITIAITSGKGGVGKTNVVVNVATALARLGNRVAVLDADFGLGNVDVLLGLAPTWHLGHVLGGSKSIGEIVVSLPTGVQIIPSGSGLRDLTALTPPQWQCLTSALGELGAELDFLLIDTAAGISDNVVDMLVFADRVLTVVSPEPSAIVDACAMVKILTSADPAKEIGLLVNCARHGTEAELVFRQLDVAATRFLQRRLRYYGFVETDPAVRESILAQRAVVDYRPYSPASRSFRILAIRLAGLSPLGGPGLRLVPPPPGAGGDPKTFEAPRCA